MELSVNRPGGACGLLLLCLLLLADSLLAADTANNSNNSNTTTTASTTTIAPTTTTAAPPKSSKHGLRADLLANYDRLVHPVKDSTRNVTVGIGMAVIHLDVDEMRSVMSVDAWMRLAWRDEFLTWRPEDYGGVKQLHFGVDEIWRPDILLYNSANDERFDPYGQAHVLIESSGDVLWVPPAHLKAYCKLSLRFWPLDQQKCKLKFGSWTSHGQEIDLELYRNMTEVEMLNFYTDNREWQLTSTFVEKRSARYMCCSESYPDVTFEFTLERKSPAYKAVIILPCLVIMLMTVCCFLLPPTSGEKITINGFAFIASVMYLIYFAFTIPFHESEVPILVMFFSNTTALIGIGLLLNVTCLSMVRERKYSGPPKFLKRLFAGTLGKFLCLWHYYHQVSSTHQRLVLELTDMAESEQQTEEDPTCVASSSSNADHSILPDQSGIMKDWLLVAAGLERLFFVLYTIAFAIVASVYI